MLMITFPPDPAKILLFNTTIEQQGKARTPSAMFVSLVVLAVLVGAALFGRQLLQLLGINLDRGACTHPGTAARHDRCSDGAGRAQEVLRRLTL